MIWEYERELTTGGFLSVEKLNEIGAQGWENYAIVGNVYFFKREGDPLLHMRTMAKEDPNREPILLGNVLAESSRKFQEKQFKSPNKHNKK